MLVQYIQMKIGSAPASIRNADVGKQIEFLHYYQIQSFGHI